MLRGAGAERDEATSRSKLLKWYAAEVDALLDQHLGNAWMHNPRIADLVAAALLYFAGSRYELDAWCVMPNHVHAVVRPVGNLALDEILHSWKSYTAHQANKLLGRTGRFWQRESYDHWIRDDADLAGCIAYTEANPVKAKLCENARDWRWSSAGKAHSSSAGFQPA